MRILYVTARYPAAQGKGDQARAFSFISHLAVGHDVTVITPSSAPPPAQLALGQIADVVTTDTNRLRRLASMLLALVHGRPAQVGWMMPRDTWGYVKREMHRYDVVVLNTIRSLREVIRGPVVLDHVDALSLNMARRSRGEELWILRAAAFLESRLLARYEGQCHLLAAQVVTSREDALHICAEPSPTVIPVGWDGQLDSDGDDSLRDIDVILTGNMAYPPNQRAARFFASNIVPLLYRDFPTLRAYVVGRDARRLRLPGVTVKSDVPDLHDFLRRARVAVAPVSGGTGTPYKVLEAAACGAAVVSYPAVLERFAMEAAAATTAQEFAAEITRLLCDDEVRRRCVISARAAVNAHLGETVARRFEEVLEACAGVIAEGKRDIASGSYASG